MILEYHLLFKVIKKICKEMFELRGKQSKFLSKSCLIIFCLFCLIGEELIHQLHLKKHIENEIFYSNSQKTNKKKKQK